jgi:hypothetical protein
MSAESNELENTLKKEKHWIYDPNICQQLYELSHVISEETVGHLVLAIGQSHAWVVTAAKIIEPRFQFQSVAMSGAIIFPTNPIERLSSNSIFYTSSLDVTQKQENGFRSYLKSLGITPENIVRRYNETGQKTIVLDFIGAGSGITSFLYILTHWAQDEELSDSMKKALAFNEKSLSIFSSTRIYSQLRMYFYKRSYKHR